MNRREIAQAGLFVAPAFVTPSWVLAQGKKPEEGVDYVALEKPAKVDAAPGKIEVTEFFWYKCPHCHRFEPELEAWLTKLPSDVSFRRMPVWFRDDFVPQQRLFYALEAMGQFNQLHGKVFKAIHEERVQMDTAEQIGNWVALQGVDRAAFFKQYESFTVASKVSKATSLQKEYRVSGVPSLGIAGKFYTDGAMAQTMSRALEVTEFLIAQQRAAKKGTTGKKA